MAILVLAGTNGAGKSSIGGEMLRASGTTYFNPDEAAVTVRTLNANLSSEQANSAAWQEGKRQLENAIAKRHDFAFETTLGGNTIPALLKKAIVEGIEVQLWYAALNSPELHLQRVRARVAKGGHDIPERDIRRRYDASRANLIELLPGLAMVQIYDNSAELDPSTGARPKPWLLLHMEKRKIIKHCDLGTTPDWAKPILMEAFKIAVR